MPRRISKCSSCEAVGKMYTSNDLCRRCRPEPYNKECLCGCGEIGKYEFVNGHNTRLLEPAEQQRRGDFNMFLDWSFRQAKPTTYRKFLGKRIHRRVAEEVLGRPLKKGEVVHHLDENRQNNQPGNVEVLGSQSEHARRHNFGNFQRGKVGRE